MGTKAAAFHKYFDVVISCISAHYISILITLFLALKKKLYKEKNLFFGGGGKNLL